jgi:hypothetical protein
MPKRWQDFQHYKDRCPPWIKLHRDLLNNKNFMRLPIASKALAPLFWLLASESKSEQGTFDASDDELEFRLRMSVKEIQIGRKSLIDNGFFSIASGVLADCSQAATPEESRGERETETEAFELFWSIYPKKVAKPAAAKAFKSAKVNGHLPDVLADIESRKQTEDWKKNDGQFVPNPATYLNQRRWEDTNSTSIANPFEGAI